MKYYDYPYTGTGSHSYYASGYGTQSADFENTVYGWTSMPNQVYSSNIAVATLIYHCGVSVDMQYGPTGSGAYTSDVRTALINYYNYSSTVSYKNKSWYSNDVWEGMLRTELDEGRPVVYRGQGTGGHAWVCDGYTGTNYFHFNWGWGGYYNGNFYLSDITPGSYNFNSNQAAIMGIVPDYEIVVPPTNLQANVVGFNVNLTWDEPSGSLENTRSSKLTGSRGLVGYNVYRNSNKINESVVKYTYYADNNVPPGQYNYEVTAVFNDGESDPAGPVTVTIASLDHDLTLVAGWNDISSYLQPFDDNIENICSPILNQLIILKNSTGFYYPDGGINTLGTWDSHSGYLIKVLENCTLVISGNTEENKTVQLHNGWNLIPVLSECDVSTEDLFSGIINYVKIVKEAAGCGVYWPSQGVNTLPVMEHGKSYFVKIFSNKTITFPECDKTKP